VDQFLFLVPPELIVDYGKKHGGRDYHQADDEKQREDDIAVLIPATPSGRVARTGKQGHWFLYPCVSGMLCGGPLPTTSWMSTDVGVIRSTL